MREEREAKQKAKYFGLLIQQVKNTWFGFWDQEAKEAIGEELKDYKYGTGLLKLLMEFQPDYNEHSRLCHNEQIQPERDQYETIVRKDMERFKSWVISKNPGLSVQFDEEWLRILADEKRFLRKQRIKQHDFSDFSGKLEKPYEPDDKTNSGQTYEIKK